MTRANQDDPANGREPASDDVRDDFGEEDALEPVSLVRASGAIMRTGALMLSAGTASYRVKEAMNRVAHSLGVTRHTEHVTLTEITATSHRGKIFRTEVHEVRQVGVNADRIARLDSFQRNIRPNMTPQQVHRELDEIEKHGSLYPDWLTALLAGAACAGFAVLNNARVPDVAAVFVGAALGQAVRKWLHHKGFNPFGTTITAASVAGLVYLALLAIVEAVSSGFEINAAGYISAVLFLVPGFAFVTGVLDLAKMDISAGLSRSAYAAIILFGAAMSVWGISLVTGVDPTIIDPPEMSQTVTIVTRAMASAVGVAGFAMLFNSRKSMVIAATCIGTVANVLRLELIDHGLVSQAATGLLCIFVGVAAAIVAKRLQVPIITLSVPSVIIMVPGISAYRAVDYFNDGLVVDALAYGVQALFVVMSTALGLVIAKFLTDREWSFETHSTDSAFHRD